MSSISKIAKTVFRDNFLSKKGGNEVENTSLRNKQMWQNYFFKSSPHCCFINEMLNNFHMEKYIFLLNIPLQGIVMHTEGLIIHTQCKLKS